MGDLGNLTAVIENIPGRTLAAKLRGLLPLIDARIKEGVSYQDIIEALNRHGALNAELKPATLRVYLSRYRKRASAPRVVERAPCQQTPAAAAGLAVPSIPVPKVRNASDLKRLRNEEIDLDALSCIGKGKAGG